MSDEVWGDEFRLGAASRRCDLAAMVCAVGLFVASVSCRILFTSTFPKVSSILFLRTIS
jgi:hypothetical protein